MISINKTKGNYVLDLNEEPYSEHEMTISSKGEKNKNVPWAVDMVSNPDVITVTSVGNNTLKVEGDISNILSEEYIILKNMRNDTARISIMPNAYYTSPKDYVFKVEGQPTITDGSLKINIVSTEGVNGTTTNASWGCTYDGKPMVYTITPSSGEKGKEGEQQTTQEVNIKFDETIEVVGEFNTLIEFTQNLSGKIINLTLTNTPDGISKCTVK